MLKNEWKSFIAKQQRTSLIMVDATIEESQRRENKDGQNNQQEKIAEGEKQMMNQRRGFKEIALLK